MQMLPPHFDWQIASAAMANAVALVTLARTIRETRRKNAAERETELDKKEAMTLKLHEENKLAHHETDKRITRLEETFRPIVKWFDANIINGNHNEHKRG